MPSNTRHSLCWQTRGNRLPPMKCNTGYFFGFAEGSLVHPAVHPHTPRRAVPSPQSWPASLWSYWKAKVQQPPQAMKTLNKEPQYGIIQMQIKLRCKLPWAPFSGKCSLPCLWIWRTVLGILADRGQFLLHASKAPEHLVTESRLDLRPSWSRSELRCMV